MNSSELQGDSHYAIWSERSAIADCLSMIGKEDLAKRAVQPSTSQELIKKFLHIIEREATQTNRQDVLERLYFAGLIYG